MQRRRTPALWHDRDGLRGPEDGEAATTVDAGRASGQWPQGERRGPESVGVLCTPVVANDSAGRNPLTLTVTGYNVLGSGLPLRLVSRHHLGGGLGHVGQQPAPGVIGHARRIGVALCQHAVAAVHLPHQGGGYLHAQPCGVVGCHQVEQGQDGGDPSRPLHPFLFAGCPSHFLCQFSVSSPCRRSRLSSALAHPFISRSRSSMLREAWPISEEFRFHLTRSARNSAPLPRLL